MWGPRFAFDVVWGGSAAMLSLIAGVIVGALAGGISAHLGWNGEIAFRATYLVASVALFWYFWISGTAHYRADR